MCTDKPSGSEVEIFFKNWNFLNPKSKPCYSAQIKTMITLDSSHNQLSWPVQDVLADRAGRSGYVVEGFRPESSNSSITSKSLSPANEMSKKTYIIVLNSAAETVSISAQSALQQAGIDSKPTKIFEAVKTFTADLTQEEAEQLKDQPNVKSIEEDRLMPMTPPAEIKPVGWSKSKSQSMYYKDRPPTLSPPAENSATNIANLNLVVEQEVVK